MQNNKNKIRINQIKIYKSIKTEHDFINISNQDITYIPQESILNEENFNVHLNTTLSSHLSSIITTLADIASCVTGIYTGNNKEYILDSYRKRKYKNRFYT